MGDAVAYSKNERLMNIPVSKIQDFPNHPYKVKDDESMAELVESVKNEDLFSLCL